MSTVQQQLPHFFFQFAPRWWRCRYCKTEVDSYNNGTNLKQLEGQECPARLRAALENPPPKPVLTIPEYLEAFPGTTLLGGEEGNIAAGMLKFTERTADRWAGPYPGGYALWTLCDLRARATQLGWKPLPTTEEARKAIREDIERMLRFPMDKRREQSLRSEAYMNGRLAEVWRSEEPFRLHFMGNDNTSYSKFYATEAEARDDLKLLQGCAPIDFDEFLELDFQFTN